MVRQTHGKVGGCVTMGNQ